MAGIYIHIPLCATRCIYCDFYSTTLRGRAPQLVAALEREMEERSDYLQEPVYTVYLGGGTPSQLGSECLSAILEAVVKRYDLSECKEITMEANPEDIPTLILPAMVNRVSMGVQTMVDTELRLLNRRHDSRRVKEAVELLRKAGIDNLSLDLMYGLPTQTIDSWEYSIEQVLKLQPEHISAYNLMVEEGTRLHTMVERGELTPCDDETCLQMAEILRKRLKDAGYEQYEISNYARPGYESRHNSSYWVQTPYLGLGPGAHSYDGKNCRQWNAPDLQAYLAGRRETEQEWLTDTDLYNERVMLGLRTRRGVALNELKSDFSTLDLHSLDNTVERLQQRGLVKTQQAPAAKSGADACVMLSLTEAGLALGDDVMRELMIVD